VTLLELKRVTPEQLCAVLEIDQLCFGGMWTFEGYQRELDSPNSDLLGLFISPSPPASPAPRSPLLGIGCLWEILDEAHITILAVHPHYQRQGLGQTLLYSLLTSAERRGLARATLEVRASNKPALSMYEKFGFKTAGRRRHYYQDTGEDALILWCGGLQHPEFTQTLAGWERQIRALLSTAGWELQVNLNPLFPKDFSLTME
jgi:ribosomal-protein-alanine N-acetyltransferase